jgi:putative cell wall-binding protein
MFRFRSFAATAATIALLAGGLALASPTPAEAAEREDVVSLTNANRANAGLPALARESSLDAMAQEWATYMASQKSMVHSSNEWRMSKVSSGYTLCCGENIAYGYTSASSVVSAWINSPGHRANILDTRYTHMGAGYNATGHYWVQVFATFPTVKSVTGGTPTISGTAAVGQKLSASANGWSPSGTKLAFQWKANGKAISGATGTTLALTDYHAGKRITVTVTGSATGYRSASTTSGQTAMVKTPYTVERVSGQTRYASAVAISKRTYPNGSGVVYIASGENFPDAVGAAPAAVNAGGALLLTKRDSVPTEVAAEVRRLSPRSIVIVGGEAAVSSAVQATLSGIANTTRVTGSSRFAVSTALAIQGFPSGATTAYVASGAGFADAVSAGSAAGAENAPILLARPNAGPDAALLDALDRLGVRTVKIAGGTAAVSSSFESTLKSKGYTVQRLGGTNRYAANQAINAQAFDYSNTAFIASGLAYPDALTGSTWSASMNAPLFITTGGCVQPGIIAEMKSMGVSKVILLGGTASLSGDVTNLATC